ncbi:MAG: hypothetical protein ACSHX0_01310 [Akkermansiaceae bacterium]
MHRVSKNTFTKKKALGKLVASSLILSTLAAQAQTPGKQAQRLRGTVFGGVHAELLDDDFLSLRCIDGWRVAFSRGGSETASHFGPVPALSGLDGYSAAFPAVNDTTLQGHFDKITDAGYMTQVYQNTANFFGVGGSLQTQYEEFLDSWIEWCDTNPTAQAFINSQSYHTKAGYPNRPYMFCYAEFVIKHYSVTYGKQIDSWVFDAAHTEFNRNGDDYTTGDADDQRLYLAFAEAARAGNSRIAVAFNNGRSDASYPSYPFAAPTRADDFTFGHAFNGNNPHGTGAALTFNQTHVARMQATNGYVHRGGEFNYADHIVGNFSSKLSNAGWDYGSVMGWDQDVFNEFNEDGIRAGGMMTWYGSYNRGFTAVYAWVYPMLKSMDDHLYAQGLSINSEQRFQPDPDKVYHIENPVYGLRLAANGSSEDAYTTNLSVNNDDTRWQFVPTDDPGLYHIQRAAGGSAPRLRTDLSTNPDMQATSSSGDYTRFEFSAGNQRGTYLLTVPLAPTDNNRFRITNSGAIDFANFSNVGNFPSLRIVEADSAERLVNIVKRNASYGLHANDPTNGGDLNLHSNLTHGNLMFKEIDRGNGFYSYERVNSAHSIDGGNGGANSQNAYVWSTSANNYNQHWQKVSAGGGSFTLRKRNAISFGLNGGGSNNNTDFGNVSIHSSLSSQNLHWFVQDAR